jgi:hypothetical protein
MEVTAGADGTEEKERPLEIHYDLLTRRGRTKAAATTTTPRRRSLPRRRGATTVAEIRQIKTELPPPH